MSKILSIQEQNTLNGNLFYQSHMDNAEQAIHYVKAGAQIDFNHEQVFLNCAKQGNTLTFLALLEYHQVKNEEVLLKVVEQDNHVLLHRLITYFSWSSQLEQIYQEQSKGEIILSQETISLLERLRLVHALIENNDSESEVTQFNKL